MRHGRDLRPPVALALAAIAVLGLLALLALSGLGVLRYLDGGIPPTAATPTVRAPEPVPPLRRYPLTTPLRLVLRDVRLTTRDGTEVVAPRVEMIAGIGRDGGPLRIRRLVLDRPVITAPARPGAPTPVRAGGGPAALGPDMLARLDLPYLTVDTLIIRDGRSRQRARPGAPAGAWAHDLRGIDLLLTDVGVGGGAPERAVIRLSLDGQVRGIRVEGAGRARLTRDGTVGSLTLDGARARIGASTAELSGRVEVDSPADGVRAAGIVIRSDDIDTADLRAIGLDWPLDGRLAGELRVDGPRDRLRVDADLHRTHNGRVSRIRATGTVGTLPGSVTDLAVTADPLIIADSAFDLRARVRGPLDSLAIAGTLTTPVGAGNAAPASAAELDLAILDLRGPNPRAAGTVLLDLDPAALGLLPGPTLSVRISGRADLSGERLDATIDVDTFPLPLLPIPATAPVHDIRGTASGRIHLGGSVREPVVHGLIRVAGDAGLPDPRLHLSDAGGLIRIDEGALILDDVTAGIGGGTLTLDGRIVAGALTGPQGLVAAPDVPVVRIRGAGPDDDRRVDLTLAADSVRVLDEALAVVDASGRLRAEGPLHAPAISGRITPTGVIWEDFFRAEPGLPLDDPPYADLAARTPWPSSGRLRTYGDRPDAPAQDAHRRRADRPVVPEAPTRRGLLEGLHGDITVVVGHGLTLRDEDSELRGTGEVVVGVEGGELATAGVVALEDGFYAQFGEWFVVYGGALDFDGPAIMPRAALRSDYDDEAPLVGDHESPPITERFPPFQFFGYGQVGETLEMVTRYSLLPATQLQLARELLLDVDPEPVGGWRHRRSWRPETGGEVAGGRAAAQGVPLAWSFIGDRLYDYLPIHRGHFLTGVASVGSPYPGRVVVAPVVRGTAVLREGVELRLGQPVVATLPELRLVHRAGGLRLELFTGPRFFAAPALGQDAPGYSTRRRTGILIRKEWP